MSLPRLEVTEVPSAASLAFPFLVLSGIKKDLALFKID
jgi:hypothetical protein